QCKKVARYASTLWKAFGNNENTCRQLLAQLASYQLNEPPYDEPFEPDCETLQTWWKSLKDVHTHLPTLATKLLNITPHSASCERGFSTLGWIYGKKRVKLAFEKVEGLAKIHRYYMTHAKEEISYINHDLTLEDMLIVANESGELDNDDSDSEEDYIEDSEVEFESLDEILYLEAKFDLDHEIFGGNGRSNNDSSRSGSENVVEPNYNYNVDNLVDEIFTR
ncbi:28987_t:CDS:1, partial [Gigaspora margarita]